jgi:predicted O-linked N-acetylglucosamine transferase (SPINDLY family)
MMQTTTTGRLEQAGQFFSRGNFIDAGKICEALVAGDEKNHKAWFLLACVYHRLKHFDDAIVSIQRATGVAPFEAAYHAQAGEIFQDAGKPEEAEAHFRQALNIDPRLHQAYNSMGILLADLKRHDEAAGAFRRAVEIKPDYAIALNNLGLALLAQGHPGEAGEFFQRAIEAKADYAVAMNNLATVKLREGDSGAAFELLKSALQHRPEFADAHFSLAGICAERGAVNDAIEHFRGAIRLKPEDAGYINRLAEFLWQQGDADAGAAMFRHAISVDTKNLRSHLCANLLLPIIARDATEVMESRKHFEEGLSALEKLVPSLLDIAPVELERDIQWDNFFLAYQGQDDRALQVRYAAVVKSVLQHIAPEFFGERTVPRKTPAKIRIGFASHNFYDCTAGHYFRSWITGLDVARFEVFTYHLNAQTDALTQEIERASASFRRLSSLPLLGAAREIVRDELDVLVYPELGMHPQVYCLAAMRLAPVQCAGWGHPVTSGHENVDYFLSCAQMEPEGAEAHYSEKLVRLPGLGTRYEMPVTDSLATREDLGLPADRILYLVPQSLFKIHPDNDALFAEILHAEPNAVLVFFVPQNQALIERIFFERLSHCFKEHGLDSERRIYALPHMPRKDFLRVNRLCDVMLDTLHWSGGNTSLDALACGLPIVTLPGNFMRGRQSMAMLKMLGCEESIASDRSGYISMALEIGRNAELRGAISQRILANRGRLFGQDGAVRALETFFSGLESAK